MEIIEYNDIYQEEVKDLLLELQEYIASIDREGYNVVTSEYKDKYFAKTIEEVKKYEGIIYLAIDNFKVIGLIVGLINNDEEATYDFVAPKRGRVTELIVTEAYQHKGVGKLLLERLEEHFKSVGCKGVLLDVFAYNQNAYAMYLHNGYFNRTIEMMKKL